MNKDKGFSLLEILIALAILVVGVAAIVNVFPVGLHATKRGADFTSAGILAQKKVAELMYLGYDRLIEIDDYSGNNLTTFDPPSNHTDAEIPFSSPDQAYSWHLVLEDTLDNTENAAISNLAQATLIIYWNDRGVQRYGTFITYIADYDD